MIVETMQNIAMKMKIDFEGATKQIGHNGVKGDIREYILNDFLEKYLPQKYKLDTGIIMNHARVQSKQQDIIIYDAFTCPLLYNTDKQKIIPIESIYTIIEVKSCLNKEQLKDCVEKIKSVREMERTVKSNMPVESLKNLSQGAQTAGLVFAYTSDTSIECLMGNLKDLNNGIDYKHRISAICILDKGIIVNVSKANLACIEPIPTPNSTLAMQKNGKDDNLLFFYLFLIGLLNQLVITPPDLFLYAKESGFKPQLAIPRDMIPKGSHMKILDDCNIEVDKAFEMMDENKSIYEKFKTPQDITLSNFIEYFEHLVKASKWGSQMMNSKL